MSKTLQIIKPKLVPTTQTKIGHAVMTRRIYSGVEVPAREMMMATLDPTLFLDRFKIGGTLIPRLTLRSISRSFLGRLATKTSMNSSPDSDKLKR